MANMTMVAEESAAASDVAQLLTDDEVLSFIIRGYHIIEPVFDAQFHAAVYDDITQVLAEHGTNPGDAMLDLVPRLAMIWQHPQVHGAIRSLMGHDYAMNPHRHCHVSPPGMPSQSWHQDGTNLRHHQLHALLGFYYPQDVTPELGPTVIMPGTHFRNAPTELMASYANLRDQILLTVPAGTVALVHYDLWHAGTRNEGTRTRYMFKPLFDRQSEPTAPSWKHDPAHSAQSLRRLTFERACACSQSDHYKERALRHEMWDHLCGAAPGTTGPALLPAAMRRLQRSAATMSGSM